ASGNGSGRPWNIAAVVFLTARICRESGLKGVHQKRATGWRTLSPTPAGSGKSARPVPAGRGTLTTGSVYAAPHQPAQYTEEHGDILCRNRNGRLPARLRQ